MAVIATLAPAELLDALRDVAGVLSDHAAALDRLEQGADLVDAASDGTEPQPAVPESAPTPGSDQAGTVTEAVAAAEGAATLPELGERLLAGARRSASSPAAQGIVTVLGGLVESTRNADRMDAERFALGLELAAERLAPADDGAHAGGLPAVVAAAADGALAALDAGAQLADVVIAAADDGLRELEAGPLSNPALVERGVVDASAAGFLLLLDALASVLTGEPLPAAPIEMVEADEAPRAQGVARYRVRCHVEPNDGCGIEDATWLESSCHEIGDVETFEPSGDRWRLSLVTARPGAAVEAVLDVGRPRDLEIAVVPPTT